MRLLLPSEKIIYDYFIENIVQIKKVDIKPTKPPVDFEPKYVWRCKT